MKHLEKLTIKEVALIVLLACGCMIPNYCIAADNITSTKLSLEQITQKYSSMEQYVAQTRRKVKNNWYPPVNSFENTATIVLKINKNGELLDSYISIPSPSEAFNESLLKAAQMTKYSPLPDEVTEDSLDIDLSFKMERRHIKFNKGE